MISREQYRKVKEFNENSKIIVRKADKNNTYVVLDKADYESKINILLSDETKFTKLSRDPTLQLKKKLRNLIDTQNACVDATYFAKPTGSYQPGYIYGNPKIHKSSVDPPLRPIISQIGTPTYDVAKRLNSILAPYIPKRYMIESTQEFIDITQSSSHGGMLASLDVVSLFTNVPVSDTVDIILENAYNHPELPAPKIPRNILREMLVVCTTETPFRNINGDVYLQNDGVSMGSPLGPLFANFYMSWLENQVVPNMSNPPAIYTRYVDDIFMIINNISTLQEIKTKMESLSVLKFTYEVETRKSLPFLDVLVRRVSDNTLHTSVFVKQTDAGQCMNYNGITSDQYKVGVIKTFLQRAYRICSDWESLHVEVERIKQLLTNNNYPQKIVDETINKFLEQKLTCCVSQDNSDNTIKFYYKNQMTSQYKHEEKLLRKIVDDHVKSTDQSRSVKLNIYYRARRLSSLFIRNNLHRNSSPSNVVYRYTCDHGGCQPNQTYIGYTICTLVERMRNHAQLGSIKKHNIDHHDRKVTTQQLVDCSTILKRLHTKEELIIAEALLIKQHEPPINNQKEGETRVLSIF